ncbi:MAG: hypothetical protein B6241_07900 [Spirochaetaceae bacterium 4572_59]|nr:MAG: hypothetical protein B6241_07900 [Spirochaetaceae bacterium 4572_59]
MHYQPSDSRYDRMVYNKCGNSGIKLQALEIFRSLGTPCLIHQPKYSMFNRSLEEGLDEVLVREKIGAIVFSPLAQGLLTDKYLKEIPEDSRAAKEHGFLKKESITVDLVKIQNMLNHIAAARNQSLAQMAIAWNLRNPAVTSVLVGASRVSQLEDNVKALNNLIFSNEELKNIDLILKGK